MSFIKLLSSSEPMKKSIDFDIYFSNIWDISISTSTFLFSLHNHRSHLIIKFLMKSHLKKTSSHLFMLSVCIRNFNKKIILLLTSIFDVLSIRMCMETFIMYTLYTVKTWLQIRARSRASIHITNTEKNRFLFAYFEQCLTVC